MSIQFHDALEKRLAAELVKLAMEIALTPGKPDDDRLRQGICQGLDMARNISNELETIIIKG